MRSSTRSGACRFRRCQKGRRLRHPRSTPPSTPARGRSLSIRRSRASRVTSTPRSEWFRRAPRPRRPPDSLLPGLRKDSGRALLPGGWINTQGKYRVVALKEADGTASNVLAKVNTDPRPPLARALGYITAPSATGYTIQADVKGVMVRGMLPDVGVCANRYLLLLDGKTESKRPAAGSHHDLGSGLPTPLPPGRIAVEEPLTLERQYLVSGEIVRRRWRKGSDRPRQGLGARPARTPGLDAGTQRSTTKPRRRRSALRLRLERDGNGARLAEAYYDNVVISPNAAK